MALAGNLHTLAAFITKVDADIAVLVLPPLFLLLHSQWSL
jgi:hypothetical protein